MLFWRGGTSGRISRSNCFRYGSISQKRKVSYLNGSDNEVVGAILDASLRAGAKVRLGTFWDDFENEILFLNALLDTLFAAYGIDTSKCYLAGFSQGGMLAYKMACAYPNRIAAIAMVSSSIDSEYVENAGNLSRSFSLIAINSMTDHACPFDSFTYKGKWYNSVAGGVLAWKHKNGCDSGPEVTAF